MSVHFFAKKVSVTAAMVACGLCSLLGVATPIAAQALSAYVSVSNGNARRSRNESTGDRNSAGNDVTACSMVSFRRGRSNARSCSTRDAPC